VSVKPAYRQLDDEALGLLRRRLDHHGGSRTALARELSIARSSLSQALDGRYPADTGRLRSRIVETFAERIDCPHLGRDIPPAECRSLRERPLAACIASRATVKHWQACQGCPHNPKRSVS